MVYSLVYISESVGKSKPPSLNVVYSFFYILCTVVTILLNYHSCSYVTLRNHSYVRLIKFVFVIKFDEASAGLVVARMLKLGIKKA